MERLVGGKALSCYDRGSSDPTLGVMDAAAKSLEWLEFAGFRWKIQFRALRVCCSDREEHLLNFVARAWLHCW